MRRYFGRAHGQRRRKKSGRLLPILAVATSATFLAAVLVWYVNPGSDVPDEAEGSASPKLVTLTPTSPPPSKASKSAGSPSSTEGRKSTTPTSSPSPTKTNPKPSPTPTVSTPTPKPSSPTPPTVYVWTIWEPLEGFCEKHYEEHPEGGRFDNYGKRYYSYVKVTDPSKAFHSETVTRQVACPPLPDSPTPEEPDSPEPEG
jgi:hypothetical protein